MNLGALCESSICLVFLRKKLKIFNQDCGSASLYCEPDPDPFFHLNGDPNQTFHSNADSDTASPQFMRICDQWSTEPPLLHSEPPRLHCERPRPSMAPFWTSTPPLRTSTTLQSSILSPDSSWIWTLTRIRIQIRLFTLNADPLSQSTADQCGSWPQPSFKQ